MPFDSLQYGILKRFFSAPLEGEGSQEQEPSEFRGLAKLLKLLGSDLTDSLRGKVVIDFGCGEGYESIALAQAGAKRVIGLDIRPEVLAKARRRAAQAAVEYVCEFTTRTETLADVVVSIDAFEHFADPPAILGVMDALLSPGGEVIVSFGPTWYHPRGGHLFSVFPWAHLICSEQALLRWRAQYRFDGARKISEVSGGLNQMTVGRFEKIVAQSPFRFASFEAVPIRSLCPLFNSFTREFTTAIVRCRLVRKAEVALTDTYLASAGARR